MLIKTYGSAVYGVDAIDIGTHTAGQIVSLTANINTNPDFMTISYLTPRSTVFPNAFGVYRDPRMLSNEPPSGAVQVVRCECSHDESCKICARRMEVDLEATQLVAAQ